MLPNVRTRISTPCFAHSGNKRPLMIHTTNRPLIGFLLSFAGMHGVLLWRLGETADAHAARQYTIPTQSARVAFILAKFFCAPTPPTRCELYMIVASETAGNALEREVGFVSSNHS